MSSANLPPGETSSTVSGPRDPHEIAGEPTLSDWADCDPDGYQRAVDDLFENDGIEILDDLLSGQSFRLSVAAKTARAGMTRALRWEIDHLQQWVQDWAENRAESMGK